MLKMPNISPFFISKLPLFLYGYVRKTMAAVLPTDLMKLMLFRSFSKGYILGCVLEGAPHSYLNFLEFFGGAESLLNYLKASLIVLPNEISIDFSASPVVLKKDFVKSNVKLSMLIEDVSDEKEEHFSIKTRFCWGRLSSAPDIADNSSSKAPKLEIEAFKNCDKIIYSYKPVEVKKTFIHAYGDILLKSNQLKCSLRDKKYDSQIYNDEVSTSSNGEVSSCCIIL